MLEAKGFAKPNSSNKYGMHKSSGGTYSKPDARVKIIPAEEITYVRHGKLCGKTVGTDGLQKRQCRRSVTPPPSSRKVSLVTPTVVNQRPPPPVSPAASRISPNWPGTAENGHSVATSCISPNWPGAVKKIHPLATSSISPKWPETAENGHSLVGGYITNSFTTQIASLSKRQSPFCRAVLSQPSGTPLSTNATAPKNLSRSGNREAYVKSCSSRARTISSANVLASHSTAVRPGTNAEPSAKSFCAPGHEKSSPMSCNLGTLQCQGTRTAVAPSVQKKLTMEPALVSPKSVLSEKFNEAYPDTAPRPSSRPNLIDTKCKVGSLQSETIIPPTQSPQSTSHARCVQLPDDFEAVPSTKSHIITEKQTNQEAPINCNVSSGTPVILHTKLHKKHYQPEACWKGKFEVTGELTHICDGLEAHFPFEISAQVYEASKLMPEILKLEARSLSHLWPKTFKMKPPEGQDIGLCFISSLQRPNGSSDHLLKNISSHIGLRTKIGATELLIFSSKLLTQEYQRKCDKFYFWGVFRERHKSYNQTSNVKIGNTGLSNGDSCNKFEDIGMNLDLTNGKELKRGKCGVGVSFDATGCKEIDRHKHKETGKILETQDKETEKEKCGEIGNKLDGAVSRERDRINECMKMLKTPDPNAVASSSDSTSQSAPRVPAGSDLVLDTPPGFPHDDPPGLTKAHCLLHTGETTEPYIDSSPSLNLGIPPGLSLDVPPGFMKAHYLPHTGETTESYIDPSHSLSLDTPPGFTKAHRLPIVSTAGSETVVSEKKPLIKFTLNVPRVAQTEALPGFTKLLAVKQEPGLPAIYNATENIASTGKADEIKSKFHDAPDNQTQGRKRDHPESPEPSPADTFKRLKVNGRIALNSVMDRRTLSSQPISREGLVDIQVSGPSVLTREANSVVGNISGDECACFVCSEEFPTG
uniref:AIPP2-like SPOC-like domain-containing protein n=1 Tax=Oryza punctata TaxID=4537 RepID=A0A0E0KAH2_ORYPU